RSRLSTSSSSSTPASSSQTLRRRRPRSSTRRSRMWTSAAGTRRASSLCLESIPASPSRAKSRLRPGGGSSNRSPRTGRRSSSSKTSTGPTPHSSSSCRISRSGRRAYRSSSSALLGPSCSRSTEREIELALHELSRRELVRPARRSTMEAEQDYAFWHVLVRDVAYEQIARTARIRKHRAAAAWLEDKAGDRAEDLADVLAYHYLEALELARATGDSTIEEELRPAARRMLELAGDRAAPLDLPKAEGYYRHALALDDPEAAARAPLLMKVGRIAVGLSVAKGEEDLMQAAGLFDAAGDDV